MKMQKTHPWLRKGEAALAVLAMIIFAGLGSELPGKNENDTGKKTVFEVERISTKKQLAIGVMAEGTQGDVVVANPSFKAIFASPEHSNKADRILPGSLIDVTVGDDNIDYLKQIIPIYKTDRRTQPKMSHMKISRNDTETKIVFTGEDAFIEGLRLKTVYTIKKADNYITISTTIDNKSSGTLKLKLGDKVEMGLLTPFVPGIGVTGKPRYDDIESDWAICTFYDFSFAIAPEGDLTITSQFANRAMNFFYKDVELSVGEKTTFTRYVVVGTKSHETVTDTVYKLKKTETGTFSGRVIQGDTRKGIGGADVQIRSDAARPFMRVFADDRGRFRVSLPVGKFHAIARAIGRKPITKHQNVNIFSNGVVSIDYKLTAPSVIKFNVVDTSSKPISARAQIYPKAKGQRFDFGPPTNAKKVANCVYLPEGVGEAIVPPGKYRIVISRGIEYKVVRREINLLPESEVKVRARLGKAYETPGYISADLSVHTDNSHFSMISGIDRAISAAVEGVECIVTGDTNYITDLTRDIRLAGLRGVVRSFPGFKIVPDFDDYNLGEYNVFPVPIDDEKGPHANFLSKKKEGSGNIFKKIGGLFSGSKDREIDSPKKLFKKIRETYPDALIQVTNPITPNVGVFDLHGYDAKEKVLPKDMAYDFDLYGLFEGRDKSLIKQSSLLLFELLKKGHSVIGVAQSDTHFTFGNEVGIPRVFVAVANDDPATITEEEFVAGLKSGNVIVSNGPFIDFKINGLPPGALVSDTDGIIDCELTVYAPPWVSISSIEVKKDGIFVKKFFVGGKEDIVRKKVKFQLRADRDLMVNVSVKGTRPYDVVVNPHGTVVAYAFTNPIYIDSDGNGKYDPKPQKPREKPKPRTKVKRTPAPPIKTRATETRY